MKNTLSIILLGLTVSLITVSEASAHLEDMLTGNSDAHGLAKREEVLEIIEEKKAEIETRKSETQDSVNEKLQENETRQSGLKTRIEEKKAEMLKIPVANQQTRLVKRYTHYQTRLELIIQKLEARIEIMESNGKDVTEAKAKLEEARALLIDAHNSSEEVLLIIGNTEKMPLTSELLTKIKSTATAYRLTKLHLHEAVQLLKNNN